MSTTPTSTTTVADVLNGSRGLLVSADDASLVLNIHRDTLYRLAGTDALPVEAVRFGRALRFKVSDLRTFVGLPVLVEAPA